MDENNNAGDHQWVKFGVLAGILLIVVLVIALLRPIIFGNIVPAVMGGDGTTAVDETVVEEIPETDTTVAPVDNTTETDTTVPTNDDSEISGEQTVTDEDGGQTAVSTVTYVVITGDTIYSIARVHNVSPDAIVTTNKILDPNNIHPGTVLLIPQP